VHGLAGAIDATLGIDEGVESDRHFAPAHAAVGQIEGRGFQAEERVVAFGAGDDRGGRQTALAARQAGGEMH